MITMKFLTFLSYVYNLLPPTTILLFSIPLIRTFPENPLLISCHMSAATSKLDLRGNVLPFLPPLPSLVPHFL